MIGFFFAAIAHRPHFHKLKDKLIQTGEEHLIFQKMNLQVVFQLQVFQLQVCKLQVLLLRKESDENSLLGVTHPPTPFFGHVSITKSVFIGGY